jgi:tRNA pseudouridine13 synthase
MADEIPKENPRKKIRLDESAAPAQRTENSAKTDAEREMRLGITSYTNKAIAGFSGILKQRYTDFLVNEILLSGKVLHLENNAGPETAAGTNTSLNSRAEPRVAAPVAEAKKKPPVSPAQV